MLALFVAFALYRGAGAFIVLPSFHPSTLKLHIGPPSFNSNFEENIDFVQGENIEGLSDVMSKTTLPLDISVSDNQIPVNDLPDLNPDMSIQDKIPDMPNLQLPEMSDLPDVKLPDILKLPEIDMPNLQLPDMSDLPDVKLPDILKLPEIDMPLPALNLPPEVSSALSTVNYQPAVDYLSQIPNLFDVATFGPQLFWLLMVVPKVDSSPIAKFVMKPLTVPLLFSLVHLGIVSLSITADGGTAPIAEFTGVFDPAGDPQAAMVGMMKYPNFVTEEVRLRGGAKRGGAK